MPVTRIEVERLLLAKARLIARANVLQEHLALIEHGDLDADATEHAMRAIYADLDALDGQIIETLALLPEEVRRYLRVRCPQYFNRNRQVH